MRERIISDLQPFSKQEIKENKGLVIKRLQLVLPERARELGVVIPEGAQQPLFISDGIEDHHLSDGDRGRIVGGYYYIHQVGEVVQSQHFNNDQGGGLFVERLNRYYDPIWGDFDNNVRSRSARSWSNGWWIAMAEPEPINLRNPRQAVADKVMIKKMRAFCDFKWPDAEHHLKELWEGLVVYNPSRDNFFPICDVEQHPKQVQPRKLFDADDIKYRFAISEDGRVRFDPLGEKA